MRYRDNKLIAVLIIMALFLSLGPASILAGETSCYLTRGQVAEMVLNAVDDYNPGIEKSDIIQGYGDGMLNEDILASKTEALIMISRGFGELDEPTGNNLRTGIFDQNYADLPLWSDAEIGKLERAGVLDSALEGKMGANEYVTEDYLNKIIKRIWSLKGSNPKDDFYAAVNKEWQDSSMIPDGYSSFGTMTIMEDENNKRLTEILNNLTQEKWKQGSKEQKLADFYQSALDVEKRNQQGAQPIMPYLKAYDNASTLQELIQTDLEINRATGYGQLLFFEIDQNLRDSSSYIMFHEGLWPTWDKDLYQDPSKRDAYIKYVSRVLTLCGEDETAAKTDAQKLLVMEYDLSEASLDPEEYYDVDKTSNIYTIKALQSLYPQLDIDKIIAVEGYQVPEKVMVEDKNLLQKSAQYLNEENLDVLKTFAKFKLIFSARRTLSEDFKQAGQEFNEVVFGIEGSLSEQLLAVVAVQDYMPDYLGEMYVQKYFSPKAKQDVESMIKSFIEVYQQKIANQDWMSDKTKNRALRKLGMVNVKVGFPDQWPKTLDNADIKSYADGGSYFDNTCSIKLAIIKENIARQGQSVDRNTWTARAYEVNAYYNDQNNDITFPAGILQEPLYSLTASREENYGGIGTIIAHEISHAFDTSGAKFDEYGNAADWWTEEEYGNFNERADKIEKFYDGIEIAPEIMNDGELTLFENIADLGGVSCALEALSKYENPDYRAFFRAYAVAWADTMSRTMADYCSETDVHSGSKIRVNRTVVNFDQFYKAFGIDENDGMYVPPGKRVRLW